MQIEFDRTTCIGMFNCVEEWNALRHDEHAGKAELVESAETDPDVFVREVPMDTEFDAEMASRVCPADAITVRNDDPERS